MEVLDIINDRDEVIGSATKAEVRARGLMCRVAFIMLANHEGKLLLQQRKATKSTYPLYWSGAVAGHVASGESYEQAAHRELQEELGIRAPLQFLGKFYSAEDKEMVAVFMGQHDGPYQLEEAAIEKVELFSLEELAADKAAMKMTTYLEKALPMVQERNPGTLY